MAILCLGRYVIPATAHKGAFRPVRNRVRTSADIRIHRRDLVAVAIHLRCPCRAVGNILLSGDVGISPVHLVMIAFGMTANAANDIGIAFGMGEIVHHRVTIALGIRGAPQRFVLLTHCGGEPILKADGVKCFAVKHRIALTRLGIKLCHLFLGFAG